MENSAKDALELDGGTVPRNSIDRARLLQKAIESIGTGALPAISEVRTWEGKGTGKRCALCGDVISRDDVEIELDATAGEAAVRFHAACHEVWADACQKSAGLSDPARR